MSYALQPFADLASGTALSGPLLEVLIDQHENRTLPTLRALWNYYRNPLTSVEASAARRGGASNRRYRLGQELGLPPRLSGWGGWGGRGASGGWGGNASSSSDVGIDDRSLARREIVIENDIAWRIHTMVDFMFGRPVTIVSTAGDEGIRRKVEQALDAVWEASGGIGLLQDMGLMGHVYGHVDLVVRGAGDDGGADGLTDAARAVRVELVEPTRGIPFASPGDFRRLDAYIVRYQREGEHVESGARSTAIGKFLTGLITRSDDASAARREVITVTEIISGTHSQVYEDAGQGPRLVAEAANLVSPGRVPVVHMQNISQPFAYAGLGEVEPLIPLQDELNTRLCDRASRVTMQSFKMFLAKGIDGFDKVPVGPGQVWSTDNSDAAVESFGGDAQAHGEDEHIEQIREALDKASGVPPLASGVVRAKIGNLTSENALRVTLMGLISKTARKRVTYGRGIAETCRLILSALDGAGILHTDPAERGVRIEWPDPLPKQERDVLAAAQAKIELGVPRERVLSELGYAPTDPGVV